MSNGNAAAGILLVAAILTGMHQAHGGSARRHVAAPRWSSPERVELGDTHIPVRSVRSVRRHTGYNAPSGPRTVVREHSDVQETPEVIVGYVDQHRGPAAFHRLTRVVEGDRVKVVRHDHSVAWFKVDSVHRLVRGPFGHERSADEVRRAIAREHTAIAREHAATGRPELRLISLPGKASRETSSEAPSDVVVSAHLDHPSEPPSG